MSSTGFNADHSLRLLLGYTRHTLQAPTICLICSSMSKGFTVGRKKSARAPLSWMMNLAKFQGIYLALPSGWAREECWRRNW